ncbi:MAG: N-6 DNA methylase [Spirochaetia bacterium]|jgi:type I restriction-modification system DNA methylase subunit/LysM repeat protein|nr:N-6 DNA methylase [Spirochaetia bacterium]
MARSTTHLWQNIHLEGTIFSNDQLEAISCENAIAQKKEDYQIPPGLSLLDEIGRSYQIARALSKQFEIKITNKENNIRLVTQEFVRRFFTMCLGWDLQAVRSKHIEQYGYPLQRIAYDLVPLTVCPANLTLDFSDSAFSVSNGGSSKLTVTQMVQEYLDSVGRERWGVVSNGKSIRLLRSSPTLSRPQYLEFDLLAILEADSYNEYGILWRIFHVSRIHDAINDIPLHIWEEWRNTAIEGGERIRERLRKGVTEALCILGSGFLNNPKNSLLYEKLATGSLTEQTYHQQLLHLIYRLLFIFATEERKSDKGLRLIFLQDPLLTKERDLYDKGYSQARLRIILNSISNFNAYNDLWEAQKIVFRCLEKGERKLALPALGGLFLHTQCLDLDTAKLSNEAFLSALYCLRWSQEDNYSHWVDYGNMGTEELGSVYESLLELIPHVDLDTKSFRFIGISDEEDTAGNLRKTTGSYYTPHFLVEHLIETTLVPVLEKKIKENSTDPETAILSLKVVDPACGSGHFLLAAARTIAVRLTKLRSDANTPDGYRDALRLVIKNCIFGVDINPMAVELTKMSLWLEGFEPEKPLGFLDSHILCGNSLLGVFNLSILDYGIPSDAYKKLTKDDTEICKELRKCNSAEQKNLQVYKNDKTIRQGTLFDETEEENPLSEITNLPEDSLEEITTKTKRYKEQLTKLNDMVDMIAADTYIGAFLTVKDNSSIVPTTRLLRQIRENLKIDEKDKNAIETSRKTAREAKAFHWPLMFPNVFSSGGFDVVLGNPPWERITLQEKEFFASRRPDIANAMNAAQRRKKISKLGKSEVNTPDQLLYQQFLSACHTAETQSTFFHVNNKNQGQYPLSGKGDVNLYALFTELFSKLKKKEGSAGIIVPTGIATDDSTKELFASFINNEELQSLYDFENQNIFPAVHKSYKFCLLTLSKTKTADFACFLHTIQDLDDDRRHFQMEASDFDLINPNTHSLPLFRSKADAELTKQMYRHSQVIWNENDTKSGNPWNLSFSRLFDMSNDSKLFQTQANSSCYPLYEAKMIHRYDHRWATFDGATDKKGNLITRNVTPEEKQNPGFEIKPRYWVDKRQVLARIAQNVPSKVIKAWLDHDETQLREELLYSNNAILSKLGDSTQIWQDMDQFMDQQSPKWLMGWRDITNSTNMRTTIATIIPRSATNDKFLSIMNLDTTQAMIFLSCVNSLIFDYIARKKVGGTDMKYFIFKQLACIPPKAFSDIQKQFIVTRVQKLLATSTAMAKALDCNLHPYNEEERAILQAEIDAFYAKKYGLSQKDLEYILDPQSIMGKDYPTQTFPGLKTDEEKQYGEYRTKRLTLEAWNRLEKDPALWT